MPPHPLLPRSAPAREAVSSRAVAALLDRLEEKAVECHSLMVVRHGHVVAEGWWAPYSAEQPHLLYSLTKSFTSVAVGLAIEDGLLSLDDRLVDVLPEHVPDDVPAQGRRITVHHLLSMTVGHPTDSLEEAWRLEPRDLVEGFLRVPSTAPEGTVHTYDNATTFVLARMVERATGRGLPDFLDERLFRPMGIEDVERDRVSSGLAFGFHGLHLTTEAVAAFGELLLRGGRWGERQLVPRDYVELATRPHAASRNPDEGADRADFLSGYGYQIWLSRHGFHGNGAYGQHCVVVPSHDLVVVVTSAQRTVQHAQDVLDAVWDCLLPGIDHADSPADDGALAERLRALSLPLPRGSSGPQLPVTAALDSSSPDSALPDGTTFVADVYVISSPHCVRLTVEPRAGVAHAEWTTVPLTGPDLLLHLRSPLMTRPDVA